MRAIALLVVGCSLPACSRTEPTHAERLLQISEHAWTKDIDVKLVVGAVLPGWARKFPDAEDPELRRYVSKRVEMSWAEARALVLELNTNPDVTIAYPVPRMVSAATSPASPHYRTRQGYLDAAPLGIDAQFAWSLPGGRGENVFVGDVELDWAATHEDLLPCASGDAASAQIEPDHGTAVRGILFAQDNGFGVTGIVSRAACGLASPERDGEYDAAAALHRLAQNANAGDVVLLKVQTTGPDDTYVPAEWVPATFDMIRAVSNTGVIVVEPAANGSQNLDVYTWFDRSHDSRAIIVGAGFELEPLDFSDYGARVDVHGWGANVSTTGYGQLSRVSDPARAYTGTFAGTSSATPIVAGAAAAIQSILIAAGVAPLAPLEMRELLRKTGTPQIGDRHIGPLPNLRAALSSLGHCGDGVRDTFEACDGPECASDCMSDLTCGNLVIDPTEACDGPGLSAACPSDCQSNGVCGNGLIDPGELCDDANDVAGDFCSSNCRSFEVCGDGIVNSVFGEVCDDGNHIGGDGCSSSCASLEVCGNGIVDLFTIEQCDGGDACESNCRRVAVCGNGLFEDLEQCEDGNASDGDGCSASCTLEAPARARGCASIGAGSAWFLILGMILRRRRRVLMCILLIACQASAPTRRSGSRLRVHALSTSEGYRWPIGWYDSKLDDFCSVQTAEDGEARCVPGDTSFSNLFGDAECRAVVAATLECAQPKFVNRHTLDLCLGAKTLRVGERVPAANLHQIAVDGRCTTLYSSELASYAEGEEVPANELVSSHEISVHTGKRLDDVQRVFGDGASEYVASLDTMTGDRCVAITGASGEPRCVPTSTLYASPSLYADASCTLPAFEQRPPACGEAASEPRFGIGPAEVDACATSIFLLEPVTQIFFWRTDKRRCEVADTRESSFYRAIGTLSWSQFAPMPVDEAPKHARLVPSGGTVTGAVSRRGEFFDETLGLACRFERSSDARWRCLPWPPRDGYIAYSDAACTQEIVVTQTQSCPSSALGRTQPATRCTPGPRVFRLDEPLFDIARIYWRTGDGPCIALDVPPNSELYSTNGEMAPSSFVEATASIE